MKKADRNTPAKAPESVTVPPITENTTPPATNEPGAQPETVTVPPITETAAPQATPPPGEKPAGATIVDLPPITDTPPATTPPANEPPLNTQAEHEAEPMLPPPGKGSRSLDDYRKLDWTKSNSELARETGVTRQRIAQIRKDIENKPASGSPDFADVRKDTIVEQVVNYDVMAASVFDMSTGMLVMTFGQEWQPKSPDERNAVCFALKNYFASKQMQDLPPGLMLTAICLAYAAPRLREPNTASKLQMAWTWCKLKVQSFRKKKSPALKIVE